LLSVAPWRAIAVEDSGPGAQAARSAGLMVVGVGSAPALRAVADTVVPSLCDPRLLDLLGLESLQV
jgi:beta-phosphoglucomutase-like phosphatase (HAD superfamily)